MIIVAFLASGTLHLINPAGFLFLLPNWTPEPYLLIYLSGIAELACAIGLLLRKDWSRYLTIATLLAVWPANWWFAINALNGDLLLAVVAWLRLPLQIPLILWAWRHPVKTA